MDSLCERSQDKLPLRDTDVGNIETRMLNLLIAIHEDVKIDISRALVDQLLATQSALNVLQFIKKGQGFQVGHNLQTIRSAQLGSAQTQLHKTGPCRMTVPQ